MSTIDNNNDMEFLRQWQRAKLSSYGEEIPSFKPGPSDVTVLTYFFRVSDYWHRHYEGKPFDVSQTEDLFYTETLPRRFRKFRWTVHIAESKPAARFCFDGCIPYRPCPDVFGFHSARGFRAVLPDLEK